MASPRLTNAPIVPAVTSTCPTDAPIDKGLVFRWYHGITAAAAGIEALAHARALARLSMRPTIRTSTSPLA